MIKLMDLPQLYLDIMLPEVFRFNERLEIIESYEKGQLLHPYAKWIDGQYNLRELVYEPNTAWGTRLNAYREAVIYFDTKIKELQDKKEEISKYAD